MPTEQEELMSRTISRLVMALLDASEERAQWHERAMAERKAAGELRDELAKEKHAADRMREDVDATQRKLNQTYGLLETERTAGREERDELRADLARMTSQYSMALEARDTFVKELAATRQHKDHI